LLKSRRAGCEPPSRRRRAAEQAADEPPRRLPRAAAQVADEPAERRQPTARQAAARPARARPPRWAGRAVGWAHSRASRDGRRARHSRLGIRPGRRCRRADLGSSEQRHVAALCRPLPQSRHDRLGRPARRVAGRLASPDMSRCQALGHVLNRTVWCLAPDVVVWATGPGGRS
jgi:hypothetical protein